MGRMLRNQRQASRLNRRSGARIGWYPNSVLGEGDGSVEAVASGGAITTDGDYTVHDFTSSGDFVLTSPATLSVEFLLVSGGGQGGGGTGAGGGAGGLSTGIVELAAGTYPIVIGVGGSGNVGQLVGIDGGSSSFNGTVVIGGGGGGANNTNGIAGACGGGGGHDGLGGVGSVGFDGGAGRAGANYGAGGGGGMGAIGQAGQASSAGNGGAGLDSSILGSTIGFCGGGGGGGYGSDPSGTATHGGGNAGVEAAANRGGGGGGGINNGGTMQGNGGSGRVVVRYLSFPYHSLIMDEEYLTIDGVGLSINA